MPREILYTGSSSSRRTFLKATGGVTTVSLAGCLGGGQDADISSRFFASAGLEEFMDHHSEQFEEETGISVDVEIIGWGEGFERQLSDITSQTGPDVDESPGGWIVQQQEADGWLPLDEYIDSSDYPNLQTDDWFDATFDYSRYQAPDDDDSHDYLVPWYWGPRGIVAYQPFLDEAGVPDRPETWEEQIEYGQTYTENMDNYYLTYMGGQLAFPQTFPSLLWSNGGQLINDDYSEWMFNSEAAVDTFQFWVENITEYGIQPNDTIEWDQDMFDNAMADRIATGQRHPGIISTVAEREGVEEEEFELWQPPRGRLSGAESSVYFGQESLGIHPWSDNVEESLEWINYLMDPEINAELAATVGFLPAVRESYEEYEPFTTDPILQEFRSLMDVAKGTPLVVGYRRTQSLLLEVLNDGLVNAVNNDNWTVNDTQELLDNAVEDANEFLGEADIDD